MQEAIASIVDEGVVSSAAQNTDLRPKLFDFISGRRILIDSGASRSIWPVSDYPGRSPDPFTALRAVNNSTIPTYGLQSIKIQPSNSYCFTHKFILSPISEPVLGWDYLAAAKLDIAWQGPHCFLMKIV